MKLILKIFPFLFIILTFFSCNEKETVQVLKNVYFSDAEIINDSIKRIYDNNNSNHTYNGFAMLSNENAFSGKNSLQLTKSKPFAFGNDFIVEQEEQEYLISAKIKGESQVFLVAKSSDGFYVQSDSIKETDKNGWKHIVLDFKVPVSIKKGEKIKTYAWNTGKDTAYIDDFSINLVSYEEK